MIGKSLTVADVDIIFMKVVIKGQRRIEVYYYKIPSAFVKPEFRDLLRVSPAS